MNPRRKNRSAPALDTGLSKPVRAGLSAAVLILIPLLAIAGSDSFRAALDFTTGVLSLVSLTASVAWGLIATDRLLLSPRHRLLAQGIHRATAVAALGFLLLHGTVKVSLGHVELLGALIPFGLGVTGTSGLIGFGSLAGLLMVVAASTGALRSSLAGRGSIAGRWRTLHMLAYPAWCAALVHGLYAGRPAATWVVVMYSLALIGVAGAVSLRVLPGPVRNRLAARLLLLIGPGAAPRPAGADPDRRDASTTPLPGAGIPPRPRYEPSSRSSAPAEPLERPRAEPRPLTPPSQQLYEAPSAGISAGYRTVSSLGTIGGNPTIRISRADRDTAAETGEIPLAERVPMTEELPVIPDPGPRPGPWPAPSPPTPTPSYGGPSAFYDPSPSYAPSPGYERASSPYPYDPAPAGPPTDPAPGLLGSPPAGEPWSAPAGDRS
ncbi:hypothetical protein ACH44C_03760 [Streptomyces purpureus]|uniref:hypothetical protein n=1 Tax=Streptomyces purpureus TaxID=1951 RepID=UPI0037A8AC88